MLFVRRHRRASALTIYILINQLYHFYHMAVVYVVYLFPRLTLYLVCLCVKTEVIAVICYDVAGISC